MTINLDQAKNIRDFLYIRNLRNKNYTRLTSNQGYISLLDQLFFFINKPKSIDLYIVKKNNINVGYLLIKFDKNLWITEVVDEKYRGEGIGSKIIHFAKKKYPYDIFAKIKKNNIPSIKLHEKNNFKIIHKDKENFIFFFKNIRK